MISEINWIELQNKYDYEKISERDLCLFYRISTSRLGRAKKKGLFKTRDKLELKNIISSKSTNRKHTEETKNKLSEIRKKYLLENPDKVPYLLNHSSKESYPEKYFTEVFKNERILVEKSYRVGLYELDFCIPDKKIDIEIDGSQHYLDEKIVESDIRRTKFLEENGWNVLRINWSEYQKMKFDEKRKYISDLKLYLNGLVDIKPIFIEKKEKIKKVKKIKIRNKKEHYSNDNKCIECELKITNDAIRCIECHRIFSRKIERPAYEKLLDDIKNSNYSAVGRKYGVSDNAIRKWIRKYENSLVPVIGFGTDS